MLQISAQRLPVWTAQLREVTNEETIPERGLTDVFLMNTNQNGGIANQYRFRNDLYQEVQPISY